MTLYYIDYDNGNDSDAGTEAAPWKTITKVNTASIGWSGGDGALFARGMTHYGQITPGASGSDGNPIIFGSYGDGSSGPAIISTIQPVTSWTQHDTAVWKSTISGLTIACFFNGVLGDKKANVASIADKYDWVYTGGVLYVYATSDPSSYYDNVEFLTAYYGGFSNSKNYIRYQQLYFKKSYYGVYVNNSTGNDIFYCVAEGFLKTAALNSMGIRLNNSSNCKIYNCDCLAADRGVYAAGGSGNLLKNSRLYANAINNLYVVSNVLTYSNCHFYAGNWNNPFADSHNDAGISGGVDGGNNISCTLWPDIGEWKANTPIFSVRVDDLGYQDGTDTWVDGWLSEFTNRNYPLSLGVVTAGGYQDDVTSWLQSRLAEGHLIVSHSRSHQLFNKLDAFDVQYTGAGSACMMTVASNTLTTSVTDGPGGEDLNVDLTNASYDNISELVAYINGLAAYTCTKDSNCASTVHSICLADVAGQDVKTSAYTSQLDKQRLVEDELSTSKTWLEANISGLTVRHYIWPGTLTDDDTQQWCYDAGYKTAGAGVQGTDYAYQVAIDVYKLLGGSVAQMHNEDEDEIKRRVKAACFVAGVFAEPVTMYTHLNDLSAQEMTWVAEAVADLDVYGSQNDIEDYFYAGEQTIPDRFWGVERGSIDLSHGDDSPCRDVGVDVGLTEDILGTSVPQETNPTIGAYEWVQSGGSYIPIISKDGIHSIVFGGQVIRG